MKISLFKYLFLIFGIIFALTHFGLLVPPKAHAQEPVEDQLMEMEGAAIAASNAKTTATTIADYIEKIAEWAATIAKWAKDDLMKALRDVVAKKIMDYIVNQTVRWIQGGGTPKFVSSWSGFAKDVGNIAFDTIVKQVGAASICSPFSLQVKLSLLPVQNFPVQLSCTLDRVVSNIKNFYVNFNQGGWPAYTAMWNPENNYYGQMLMIQDNLQMESAKKLTAATNEALSGSGFLSVKKCVDPIYSDQVTGIESYCQVYDSDAGECAVYGTRDITTKVQTGCNKEEIQTPGAAVGAAVANSITSDSQWGANIQSWVSALVNALINRVVSEGFMAMKNAVTGGSSGVSSADISSANSALSASQNLVDISLPSSNNNSNSVGVNSNLTDQQASALQNFKQLETSNFQKFLNEEQYLLNAKNKTLLAYQLEENYLLAMTTTTGCLVHVYRPDIDAAIQSVSNISGQVATLQSAVSELTNAIDAVNRITSITDLSQGTLTTNSVFDKYNTADFYMQIQTGSARGAADSETVTAQTASSNAYNNFISCAYPSVNGGGGGDSGR